MLEGFSKVPKFFAPDRLLWCTLLACHWLLSAPSICAGAAPASARLDGQNYTRVSEWARNRQLTVSWIRPDKVLQINSGDHKLLLYVGSREARIDGILAWLSFPVLQHSGAVYVSSTDVRTTFEPVLFPPKSPSKVDLICIDPGHGGKDPGHRSGPYSEKRYTLLLAQEVQAQLLKAGFKVALTRTTDSYLDLERRATIANSKRADLLVSLHYNATAYPSASQTARGVEVFCMTPAGAGSTNTRGGGDGASKGNKNDSRNMLAAYHLQRSMVKSLSTNDRGIRRARFAVLRSAEVPAVLVEAGFMSHPVEGKQVLQAAHRKRVAQAIVEGIKAYRTALHH